MTTEPVTVSQNAGVMLDAMRARCRERERRSGWIDYAEVERFCDQTMKEVLAMSIEEVDTLCRALRPNEDWAAGVLAIAKRAAAKCDAEKKPYPPQLKAALAQLRK